MIDIGKLKLLILALEPPVQAGVEAVVKALHSHDAEAAHDALESALRIQFEARQLARRPPNLGSEET